MAIRHILASALLATLVALSGAKAADEQPPPKKAAPGFLGVLIGPAREADKGVLVRDVTPGSPADKAGLKRGDVLQKINDKAIRDEEQFMGAIAALKAGDPAALIVLRDGKEQTLTATAGERPKPPAPQRPAVLGIYSEELTPTLKKRLDTSAESGVVIMEVFPESPAAKAGLKRDDVVTTFDDKPIKNAAEMQKAILDAGPGKEVTLQMVRGKEKMTVKATLQQELTTRTRERIDPNERIRELERQVQTLQKRVEELEKKLNKPE